jgi:hypothetical protein
MEDVQMKKIRPEHTKHMHEKRRTGPLGHARVHVRYE